MVALIGKTPLSRIIVAMTLPNLNNLQFNVSILMTALQSESQKGIGSLPALSGYSASLLLWWHPREPGKISTYEYDCSESLSLRHYLPEEFDETDQFFNHEEPDLRHAVHAAYLACLEESELPAKSESSDLGENVPTGNHLPIMEELPADFKTIAELLCYCGQRTSWP